MSQWQTPTSPPNTASRRRQIAKSVEPSVDDEAREPIRFLFGEAISWRRLAMHSPEVVINQVDVSARDLDR